VFAAHGWQKFFQYGLEGVAEGFAGLGIPFPAAAALLVSTVELAGGVALVLGAVTRLAALGLSAVMAVALVQAHLPGGFFLPTGIEFVLALLAATVSLALTGPGRFAVDSRFAEGEVVWSRVGSELAEETGAPVGSRG
jgi:putative oxidoreductase